MREERRKPLSPSYYEVRGAAEHQRSVHDRHHAGGGGLLQGLEHLEYDGMGAEGE